jgi:S1-C subfamily serine protease
VTGISHGGRSGLWVVAGLVFLGVVATVLVDLYRTAAMAKTTERLTDELGFDYGTPYRDGREQLVITRVEAGKPMADAGLRPGDVLPAYSDTRDFFRDLARSRGSALSVAVQRDGGKMTAAVRVPVGPGQE